MNPKPPKSYPDKPKKAPKLSQGYPAPAPPYRPEKKKYKPKNPKRYPPDPAEGGYYAPYKRKPDRNENYIYKQDLIQKGFQVYNATTKPDKQAKQLIEAFPECFAAAKRKVIIDPFEDAADEYSMISKSRLHDRDELRGELLHLMDNEDIPDWYLEAPAATDKPPALFDFSQTVNRTKAVNAEISRRAKDTAQVEPIQRLDDEINFEELDQLLEKKFILAKREQSVDESDAEGLEAFASDNEEKEDKSDSSPKDAASDHNSAARQSKDESLDYFTDLQVNIKKMLFNKEESPSEEDKDSEESFQESLGFEPQRDRKTHTAKTNEPAPLPQPQDSKAPPVKQEGRKIKNDDLKPSAFPSQSKKPVENALVPAPAQPNKIVSTIAFNNFPVLLPAPVDNKFFPVPVPVPPMPPLPMLPKLPEAASQNNQKSNLPSTSGSLVSNLPLNKLELENPIIDLSKIDEYKNISPEERESRKNAFLEKYGYLDPIMCQIVYEILNSKQRQNLNKFSINGFNQKSVEKYCQNKYKIFSLYLQGDIVSKVWLYKDKLGHVQGPFMSYDMDIWNGEGNYFAEDLKIALMNSPFLPLQMYLDRAQMVIDVVQNFLLKNEHKGNDLNIKNPNENQRRNNNNQNRKYTFHKKSETDKEVVAPVSYKSPAELTSNFSENFPPLSDALAKVSAKLPRDPPPPPMNIRTHSTSAPGEPSLLDTLRATFAHSNSLADPRKDSLNDPSSNKSATQTTQTSQVTEQPKAALDDPTQLKHQNTQPSSVAPQQDSRDQQTKDQQNLKDQKEDVKLAKVGQKKDFVGQKQTSQVMAKKNSMKKPPKRGKTDLREPYADPDASLNYVEKVEAQEKLPPRAAENHSDLTLSIKSMLGLNFK